MGVYIKDVEMPKSCDECRIMTFEDTNCVPELFCGCPIVFQAHPQGVGHRPDYCPLTPIPPHGRLIDADALTSVLETLKGKSGNPVIWDQMIDIVKDIHTVIEAEDGK